jgi:hypothetical protein
MAATTAVGRGRRMSEDAEPTPVQPAGLFDFIGGHGLAVVFLSVHPVHRFNPVLGERLRQEHGDIGLATIDLRALILTAGPALPFLHQGLRGCGAPSSFGVLPGYWLFRGVEMLAWDAGLPALDDVAAIARSALLGALWSGVTRNVAFVGQAVQVAAEELAAQRVAFTFRHAVSREAPRAARADSDYYWACQVLGVSPTATDQEVHEAWRKRRMDCHPDHTAHDPGEFERRSRVSADINRARDVIVEHRGGRPH